MSAQFGFVNIIKTTGCGARSGGGSGLLRGLVALLGLGMLGTAGYRFLDSALRGVAASTAEANRVVGWAVAAVLVIAALTAAVWLLLARRRALREAPVIAAFTAATDRALAAHRQAALMPGSQTAGLGTNGPARTLHPVKVTATRIKEVSS